MKRPLAVLGFTYLITQAVACYFSMSVNLGLSLCCFALGAVLWLSRLFDAKRTLLLVLFTAALSTGALFLHQRIVYAPAAAMAGMEPQVTAHIVDTPERLAGGGYRYTMETTAVGIEDAPQRVKILVDTQKPLDVDLYDTLQFKTSLRLLDQYNWSEEIYLGGYITSDIIYTPVEDKPISYYFVKFREEMNEVITSSLPDEEGGLVSAMVTSDRSLVKETGVYDLFTRTGVTHYIAISGLHMSILGAMALYLLRKLKFLPHFLPYLLASVFVLLYMAVLGFAPSATRSGIMLIVFYLARAMGRKSDSLNSLGLALFLIAVPNPFAASSVSLQLSAAATLAMLTLAPKVSAFFLHLHPVFRKYWFFRWALDLLGMSIGVTVFLMPLTLLYFGNVSFISPLATLVLSPLMPVMIVGGFFTALVGMALPWAAAPFAFFAGIAAKVSICIVSFFAKFDFLSLTDDAPFVGIWMIFAVLIMAGCYLGRNNGLRLQLGALLCAALFLVGALSHTVLMNGVTSLQVYGGESAPYLVADFPQGKMVMPLYEPTGELSLPVTDEKISLLYVKGDYTRYESVFDQYEIDAVVVPDTTPVEQLTAMLPEGCKIYPLGSMKAKIGDATVETLAYTDGTATTIRTGDFSLLLTDGQVDAAMLPLQRTAADVWVANGNCENSQMIAASYGIAVEGEKQRIIQNAMLSQGAETATFDHCERIDILTRGGEDIKVLERGGLV